MTSSTPCDGSLRGGSALDPEVVARLVGARRGDPLGALTPREHEVLAVMAEGRTNAGIARRLWADRANRRDSHQ
jgi:DNA-binding NarL/FixJ family response regulator